MNTTRLTQLSPARGQAMRDNLINYGLDAGRVSVAAPAKQAAKDKQVGSKMVLGAAGVARPAPAASPAGQAMRAQAGGGWAVMDRSPSLPFLL